MKLELTPNGVQLQMGNIQGTVMVPQYIKVGNTALMHTILMFGPQQTQEIIDWFKDGVELLEKYQKAIAEGAPPLPAAVVPPPPPPPIAAMNAEQAADAVITGKRIVESALGIAPPESTIPIDKPAGSSDTLPSLSGLTDEAVAAYIANHKDPEALIKLAAEQAPQSAPEPQADFIGPIQQDAQGNRILPPPP